MSNSIDQAVAGFEALISKWKGAYLFSTHSYVAVKDREGKRILFGRILIAPTQDALNNSPFQFETQRIIAGRFVKVIKSESITNLIANTRVGRMDTDKGTITLATEHSESLSAYFAPIYHPLISDGPRLPGLIVRGTSIRNLLVSACDNRQFDWEMRAAEVPFDSLDELLSHCMLPNLMQMGDSSTIEMVARAPAAIGTNSVIKGNEAAIEIRMAKALDGGKIRIGYKILQRDHQFVRGSVTGERVKWREEKDLKIGFHRFPLGEASVLQAFLSYDDIALHQWWITDPQKHLNPWQAIHRIFDHDSELLGKMLLKPETDKAFAFESAVSTLLTLLGFSVANYGRIPKLQKGPDIIAVTPSGNVGIIECTIGLINANDKLAKLVQRTTLIKEKLADARYGHLQLQPAIVTPLSREEVAADLPAAGDHGIAVVCKQELENALAQVGLPPNADRIFQDSKKLIPASDQTSLFPS